MGKIRIKNFFDPPPELKANVLCLLVKVETFLTPSSVD